MGERIDPGRAFAAVPLAPGGSWWQRLWRKPSLACEHAGSRSSVHLEADRVRLRNGAATEVRRPPRPPLTVCSDCLLTLLERELKAGGRRVIAFEPGREGLAAYSFLEQQHLGDAELRPEDVIHCQSLVAEPLGGCQKCGQPALLLLVKRGATTESGKLSTFRGGREYYCPAHGAERLLGLLRERLPRRPVSYFNFPYGERGLYIPTD